MKRHLLLALILCLGMTAGTFAQEVKVGDGTLTFNGKISSGLFYDADNAAKWGNIGQELNTSYIGSDGRVRLYNDTDSATFRVEISTTYVQDNIGFKARLRTDNTLLDYNTGTVSGNLITRYAYGWVNLLDDKIKVSGGLIAIADNVWGTQGDGDWDIAGNGLRLELKPIDGLDFGAFLHVPTMDNPVVPQYGDKRVRKVDLARTLGETSFGFRYTRPMFYASAQYWMDSDIDGTDIYKNVGGTITTETPVWSDAGDEKQLMFGAGLTGVPNLVATVEGNLSGLGNTAARGWTDLRQTVSYTLFGKLTLGMKAKELLWGYDIRKLDDWPLDLKPWMQFKPFANYKVSDEFTAGMEVGYGFGNLVNGDVTDRKFVNEKYDAYLKPNLAYNFKGGLALKAWYMFTAIGYTDLGDNSMFIDLRQSDSPVDKDNTVSSKPLLKQQVALEFAWSY